MELQKQRKSLQISKYAGVFHYSEEPGYIESSPLTPEQKEYLSTSYVGATKLIGDGLLSSIANQEHTVADEVFEFSGTDLISADINPKTLKFKKD